MMTSQRGGTPFKKLVADDDNGETMKRSRKNEALPSANPEDGKPGVVEAASAPVPLNDDERAELMRLRKESARLKEEKEILEKAHAFFARKRR